MYEGDIKRIKNIFAFSTRIAQEGKEVQEESSPNIDILITRPRTSSYLYYSLLCVFIFSKTI